MATAGLEGLRCSPLLQFPGTQEQMEEMKKKEDHLEKEMAEVLLQNKRLAEPLQRARDEVSELQRKLAHYEKDKAILAVSGRALGIRTGIQAARGAGAG